MSDITSKPYCALKLRYFYHVSVYTSEASAEQPIIFIEIAFSAFKYTIGITTLK